VTEAKRPSEAGPSDSSALQAELRKLRGVNAELLREKEEWIRKLKNRELSTRAGGDGGHEVGARPIAHPLSAPGSNEPYNRTYAFSARERERERERRDSLNNHPPFLSSDER
jgi:hypothetical protein